MHNHSMGMLSTLGNIFGSLIFIVALSLLIVAIALAKFTDYATLQPVMTKLLADGMRQQMAAADVDQQANALKTACTVTGNKTIALPSEGSLGQLELQCDKVLGTENSDFPNLYANATFNSLYNKEYTCDFLHCIQTLQGNDKYTVLISSLSNAFFHSIILPLAIATIVGIMLIIFSLKKLQKILKSIGISCILAGIMYFAFPIVQSTISGIAKGQQVTSIDPVLSVLFEGMRSNLLLVLIAGIALTTLGFVISYLEKRNPENIKGK